MDTWDALIAKLDQFPTGAPHRPELVEILKMLFTEGQAKLAVELGMRPVTDTAEALAGRAGRERASVEADLEAMAAKGLVFTREKGGEREYTLLPLVPGIFELQFMKGEVTPHTRTLARLFDAYYHKGWGESRSALGTGFARTIVVEEAIPEGQAVEPYERVHHLIENAKQMALTTCYCRHEHELLGDSCGAPKDVCMLFGPFVEFAVERGFARRASRPEMLDALDRAEKAGLVHLSDNIQDKINFICNCCGCCCGILGTITKLNRPRSVAKSSFTLATNDATCTGCGKCVNRCQVKALSLLIDRSGPKKVGKSRVDHERCIGCGLCLSVCESHSLSLARRDPPNVPFASMEEMGMAIVAEKFASGGTEAAGR